MAKKRANLLISPFLSKTIYSYMAAERSAYNHIVDTLNPIIYRDFKQIASLNNSHVELLGALLKEYTNIYITQVDKLPEYLVPHTEAINALTSQQRFLINKLARSAKNISNDTHVRMGKSILHYYIMEAQKKMFGSANPLDILPSYTSFEKNGIQLGRDVCQIIQQDHDTFIKIPYVKDPIKVDGFVPKDWTLIYIRQDDEIAKMTSDWVVYFNTSNDPDLYQFKTVERLGRSSIVESAKNRKW